MQALRIPAKRGSLRFLIGTPSWRAARRVIFWEGSKRSEISAWWWWFMWWRKLEYPVICSLMFVLYTLHFLLMPSVCSWRKRAAPSSLFSDPSCPQTGQRTTLAVSTRLGALWSRDIAAHSSLFVTCASLEGKAKSNSIRGTPPFRPFMVFMTLQSCAMS